MSLKSLEPLVFHLPSFPTHTLPELDQHFNLEADTRVAERLRELPAHSHLSQPISWANPALWGSSPLKSGNCCFCCLLTHERRARGTQFPQKWELGQGLGNDESSRQRYLPYPPRCSRLSRVIFMWVSKPNVEIADVKTYIYIYIYTHIHTYVSLVYIYICI